MFQKKIFISIMFLDHFLTVPKIRVLKDDFQKLRLWPVMAILFG